ncbi:hypothetical protein D9M68_672360 [compost metagenome]
MLEAQVIADGASTLDPAGPTRVQHFRDQIVSHHQLPGMHDENDLALPPTGKQHAQRALAILGDQRTGRRAERLGHPLRMPGGTTQTRGNRDLLVVGTYRHGPSCMTRWVVEPLIEIVSINLEARLGQKLRGCQLIRKEIFGRPGKASLTPSSLGSSDRTHHGNQRGQAQPSCLVVGAGKISR